MICCERGSIGNGTGTEAPLRMVQTQRLYRRWQRHRDSTMDGTERLHWGGQYRARDSTRNCAEAETPVRIAQWVTLHRGCTQTETEAKLRIVQRLFWGCTAAETTGGGGGYKYWAPSLTYAHRFRWNIGHLRPLAIALCSGLFWLLWPFQSSCFFAVPFMLQYLASNCCEASLSSSTPAGSRSGFVR